LGAIGPRDEGLSRHHHDDHDEHEGCDQGALKYQQPALLEVHGATRLGVAAAAIWHPRPDQGWVYYGVFKAIADAQFLQWVLMILASDNRGLSKVSEPIDASVSVT
jgi:hypothetical protein